MWSPLSTSPHSGEQVRSDNPLCDEFAAICGCCQQQTKCLQNQHFLDVRCQLPQRLLKTLNRDDLEVVGILLRVLGVLARRDEEVIHIRAARPIVFCLTPPIGITGPVERERPGRRDPAAVRHVAAELARDLEREREPGRRPADAPEVDVDLERQLDRPRPARRGSRRSRATGRPGSRSSAPSPRRASSVSAGRSRVSVVARLPAPDLARGAPRASSPAPPSTATIDVSGLEHLRRGHIGRDGGHEDATRRRDDVVAELAERDHRRGLLRALHVRGVLPVTLLVGLAGRGREPPRTRTSSRRAGERQQLLEQRIRRTNRST